MAKIPHTDAPQLYPFKNLVTVSIAAFIAALALLGTGLALVGIWLIGVPIFLLSMLMLKYGLTEHPAEKPRTAGLVTIWDHIIVIGGRSIVVGGTTILADYFPFFIGTIKIDITNRDKDFPLKILSEDGVQMEGSVSLTQQPDIDDLPDYVQAGEMENIWLQQDDILFRETQKICRIMGWRDIAVRGEEIQLELRDTLEEHDFGVKIKKLQVKLLPPEKVVKDAEQHAREELQRQAEKDEFQTTLESAKIRHQAYKDDPTMADKKVTLQDCIDEIRRERQIRNNKAFRIDTNSTGGSFILSGPINFSQGDKSDKEKGD